jgi:tRNA (cytidine/uridine-2'-O-)-methyltransferase
LDGLEDRVFHLPMLSDKVRSLNLANVATAVIFQAMKPQLRG